jgi:hypothetical protein
VADGLDDGWPVSQLPPTTGRRCLTPATGRPRAADQPRLGGLFVVFALALGGQQLAQAGMLVVHDPPFCSLPSASDLAADGVAGQLSVALNRSPRIWRLP